MKIFVTAYVGAMVAMIALDAVWLSTMEGRLYRPQLGHLLAERFSGGPAVAFYALYLFGVCIRDHSRAESGDGERRFSTARCWG